MFHQFLPYGGCLITCDSLRYYFIPASAGIKAKVLQKYRLGILQLFELSSSRFGPRIGAVREANFPASHNDQTKGATP
jgi:hypothetical protein